MMAAMHFAEHFANILRDGRTTTVARLCLLGGRVQWLFVLRRVHQCRLSSRKHRVPHARLTLFALLRTERRKGIRLVEKRRPERTLPSTTILIPKAELVKVFGLLCVRLLVSDYLINQQTSYILLGHRRKL